MSGAEIVFGLGVACNAMQIISFGREVYNVAMHLQESSSPAPDLSRYALTVTSILKDIQDGAARTSNRRPLRTEEIKVIEGAQKCAEATDKMISMMDGMRISEGKTGIRKGFSTFGKGMKAVWYKKDLERAEKVLTSQQRLLETRQLASICSQNEAVEIQASDHYKNLNHKLQHFIDQYAIGVTALSGLVAKEAQTTRDHVTATGENIESHIDNSTALIRRELLQQQEARHATLEYDALLSSLRFPEMNGRRNRVPDHLTDTFSWVFDANDYDRASGQETGDWLSHTRNNNHRGPLENESALEYQKHFKDWLRSDGKIFWIQGKPGSGKSTLMKFIVSRLEQGACATHRSQETIILSYFFWKPGTELQHSVRGMLCSLLQQLLEKDTTLMSTVRSRQTLARKKSHHDWSVSELHTLLRDLLVASSSVLILLDGLDEIVEVEDSMLDSLEFLSGMKVIESVRACVASRSERRFVKYFGEAPCLTMQQVNQKDIFLLVESSLLGGGEISHAERKHLLTSVAWGADGVFLWALLVVKSLNKGVQDGNTFRELESRLQALPRNLESLYEDMWQRLGEDTAAYRQTAAQFFHCVKSKKILNVLPINVLEIAAATNDSFLSYYELLNDGSLPITELDMIKIDEICQQTRDRMDTRCAGLLALTQNDPDDIWWHKPRAPYASRVLRHATADITWVHRSALDFLTDTLAGQSIMTSCNWTVEEKWERVTKGMLLSKVLVKGGPLFRELQTPHGEYQWHTHLAFDQYYQVSEVEQNRLLSDDEPLEETNRMVQTTQAVLDGVSVARTPLPGACPGISGDFSLLYYQAMFERADLVISRLEALSLDEFLAVAHEPLLGAATFDSDGKIANFRFTTRRDDLIRYILIRVQTGTSEGTLSSNWRYAIRQVHWSLVCGGMTLAGECMRFRISWTSDLLKTLCNTLDLFDSLSSTLQASIDLHGTFKFGLLGNRRDESFSDNREGPIPHLGHVLESGYFGYFEDLSYTTAQAPGYFVVIQASYSWAKSFIRSVAAAGDKNEPCEAQLHASPRALRVFYAESSISGAQSHTVGTYLVSYDADLTLIDQALGPLFGPKTGRETFNKSTLGEAVRKVASDGVRARKPPDQLQTYLKLQCCFHPVTKLGLWTKMPCVRSFFTPEELKEADRMGRQNSAINFW